MHFTQPFRRLPGPAERPLVLVLRRRRRCDGGVVRPRRPGRGGARVGDDGGGARHVVQAHVAPWKREKLYDFAVCGRGGYVANSDFGSLLSS